VLDKSALYYGGSLRRNVEVVADFQPATTSTFLLKDPSKLLGTPTEDCL